MGSEPCVLSIKPRHLPENLCDHLAKDGFVKTFNIFHIPILSFSCFHFIIIPPKSKKISSLTRILLTACSTAEEVDQALIIAVKFMVDFVTFLSSITVKCISNLYDLTDLTSTVPTTYTAYISFEWIQSSG